MRKSKISRDEALAALGLKLTKGLCCIRHSPFSAFIPLRKSRWRFPDAER